MIILNIPLNHICTHLVSNRLRKISILPKFSSPQLLFHLWKLIKNLTRQYTLQHPNQVSYRIPRWKTQNYMNMIWSYSHLLDFKPMVPPYLQENLSNSSPNTFSLNPFSVFWRPYQLVFRVVNPMCTPSDCHGSLISHFFCLWQTHLPFPTHKPGFSDAILILIKILICQISSFLNHICLFYRHIWNNLFQILFKHFHVWL